MNKKAISIESATAHLMNGKPLSGAHISGHLKIEGQESWPHKVVIKNCVIEFFSGSVTHFTKPVNLINCHFKACDFAFAYFLGGLNIDNCTFDTYLDFQAVGVLLVTI